MRVGVDLQRLPGWLLQCRDPRRPPLTWAADTQLAHFPQTLDCTTDTTTAQFANLGDLDGRKKSQLAPNDPFTETGVCIDTAANTVTTVASGAIFCSGGPTYRAPSGDATHGSPPQINFAGLQTRCIVAPKRLPPESSFFVSYPPRAHFCTSANGEG